MIRLRPHKKSDSKTICKWLNSEEVFYKWSAGRYQYPLTAEQLDSRFEEFQLDPNAWFMTALDETGNVCGHFIFRKADYENNSIHMGFIVVSPDCRGKGIGKQMLSAAIKYAAEILGMKRITLGVFANNPAAVKCYESIGFKPFGNHDDFEYKGQKWDCIDMEWISPIK